MDTPSPSLVSVKATSQDFVLNGISNSFQVLFEVVTAADPDKTKRPAFELSIVLDRSGSMSGASLENCKTAIQQIIQNLDVDDVVHFITYDSLVQVVFSEGTSKQRESLLQKVAAVQPGGTTNLCGGLEAGFKQIDLSSTRQKRIFLFSDGLVNSGVQDKQQIQNKAAEFHAAGVNTSTLGIGIDYDEPLMRNIAEYGHGDYFFLESSNEIERIIGRAISGLLWTVGTSAVLHVCGKNGAVLKKVYHHKDLIKGVSVGDLKENDVKQYVAEFEYGPPGSGENTLELLTYELQFDSKKTNQKETIKGSLCMTTTDERTKVGVVPDKVIIGLKVAQTGEHDATILELLDQKQHEKALKLQKAHVEELKKIQETAQDQNGFFKVTVISAEKSLRELEQNKGNLEEAKKYVGYSSYLNSNQCNFEGFTYCPSK